MTTLNPPRILPLASLFASVLLVALMGAGCKAAPELDPRRSCAEGTYWDLRSETCRTPVTPEDSYILENFSRYQSIVDQAPTGQLLNQASLARWISEGDFNTFMLDPAITSVDKLVFRLPVLVGGAIVPITLPPDTATSTAVDVGFREIKRVFGKATTDNGQPLSERLDAIKAAGLFSIGIVRFKTLTPAAAVALWERQRSLIRLMQPIVSESDYSQYPFEPNQVIE